MRCCDCRPCCQMIRRAASIPGVETIEAQDAQIVLADASLRLPDKDDPPRHGVVVTLACGVQNDAVRIGIEGVQPEIAPPRILRPVRGEGHRGAAPVGRDVATQAGDLKRLMLRDRRHRAVLDAGRDRSQSRRLQRRDHVVGRQGRGDVDVVNGRPNQGVAHAAAVEAGAVQAARRCQRRHDRPRRRGRQPGLTLQPMAHAASSAAADRGSISSPYSRPNRPFRMPAVTPQM